MTIKAKKSRREGIIFLYLSTMDGSRKWHTERLFPLVLTRFVLRFKFLFTEKLTKMKKIRLPDLKFEKTKLKSKISVIIPHENGPLGGANLFSIDITYYIRNV